MSKTINKWSVTIHQSNHNGSSSPKCRWVVDPPGYNYKNRNWGDYRWHVAGGAWFAWNDEITKREAWEKALAYADQKARTREVVLPRLNLTKSAHKASVKTQSVDNIWVKLDHNGVHIQHHFPPRQQGRKTVNTKGMYIPQQHILR